jgi:hypothetical protein
MCFIAGLILLPRWNALPKTAAPARGFDVKPATVKSPAVEVRA